MDKSEFVRGAEKLGREAGVLGGIHGYFLASRDRIHRTCRLFGLFDRPLGDVLEIGPFYAYTPFLLRDRASSVTVLEGDDPVVKPLLPLYKDQGIQVELGDLFEAFGPTASATRRLPFPDASFDTFLCWETMEHFNFNPVPFVREVRRVLRPGGVACVTVPNRASFQNLWMLLSGWRETAMIDSYIEFADYESNGKKAFYGFHWREYTRYELVHLFRQHGFEVESSGTFTEHLNPDGVSPLKKLVRQVNRLAARLFPRFGGSVHLIARKPAA